MKEVIFVKKKSKPWEYIVAVLCLAFIVYGFYSVPSIGINAHKEAKASGETLTLTVDYTDYGTGFEIGQDIRVYTDSALTNELSKIRCTPENGNYNYEFEWGGDVDTIYITPPVLYIPTEIDKEVFPLSADMASSPVDMSEEPDEWFSISDISVDEYSDGVYSVAVSIIPNNDELPRFPMLVVGEERIGGMSSLDFDEGGFSSGEFVFYVPCDDIELLRAQLSAAYIEIEDSLSVARASDLSLTSSVKSLRVVIAD